MFGFLCSVLPPGNWILTLRQIQGLPCLFMLLLEIIVLWFLLPKSENYCFVCSFSGFLTFKVEGWFYFLLWCCDKKQKSLSFINLILKSRLKLRKCIHHFLTDYLQSSKRGFMLREFNSVQDSVHILKEFKVRELWRP